MNLLNSRYQQGISNANRADGALVSTSPRLILPQATSRSYLLIQNISNFPIFLDHGGARATATLTNGVVTSLAILNPGFGYTLPPIVQFKGGGGTGASALTASLWDGRGQIDGWPTPTGYNLLITPPTLSQPAQAIAVLTAGVVTSFVIQNGGSGYLNPPEVLLVNNPLDPYGCADPSNGSGSGIQLAAGASYGMNGTFCHTDAISLYGSTASSGAHVPYLVEYAP